MRRFIACFGLLLTVCFFPTTGCGGRVAISDGGGTALLHPDKRNASLLAIRDYIHAGSAGRTREQYLQGLVDLMKSDPNFLGAGFSTVTDNAWGVFVDGVPFMLLDNTPPDPQTSPLPDVKHRLSANGDNVPAHKKVRLAWGLGTAFNNVNSIMSSMLSEAGYEVSPSQSAEVVSLMNDFSANNYGVFYINTHSGMYRDESSGRMMFGLSSNTIATKSSELQEPYKSLLSTRKIGIGWVIQDLAGDVEDLTETQTVVDDVVARRVYILNAGFISSHLKMPRVSSLAIISSCTSFDPGLRVPFKDAGAGAYIGWSSKATTYDGGRIILRAVDRMLGKNDINPDHTPDARPFPIESVFEWMSANNLDSHTVDNRPTRLQYEVFGSYGLLRPSIKSVRIVEPNERGKEAMMTIAGVFGSTSSLTHERKVLVDGVELQIESQTRTEIVALLPEMPKPGSSGDCVVVINDHKSNAVPITAWDLDMLYRVESSNGDAVQEFTLNISLRMDLHKWRPKLSDEPIGKSFQFMIGNNSGGEYLATGTYTDPLGCKVTISGSGTVVPYQSLTKWLAGFGFADTDRLKITNFALAAAGCEFDVTAECGNGEVRNGKNMISPLVKGGVISLTIDPETYQIVGGSLPCTIPGFGEGSLQWDDTDPIHPPTDQTKS